MADNLTGKFCTACRGDVPALDPERAGELLAQLPDWQLNDDATWLWREFRFDGFQPALEFANQAADIADREGHHPVITFSWGFCRIETQTKKIHGLHENDFILAAKIDQLFH